jgi:hypothetical protein
VIICAYLDQPWFQKPRIALGAWIIRFSDNSCAAAAGVTGACYQDSMLYKDLAMLDRANLGTAIDCAANGQRLG